MLLGSEADSALFERLCVVVHSLGGSISETEWGLGGSQVVATYAIVLPDGTLEAVTETYVGLSLRGTNEPVKRLSSLVLSTGSHEA